MSSRFPRNANVSHRVANLRCQVISIQFLSVNNIDSVNINNNDYFISKNKEKMIPVCYNMPQMLFTALHDKNDIAGVKKFVAGTFSIKKKMQFLRNKRLRLK